MNIENYVCFYEDSCVVEDLYNLLIKVKNIFNCRNGCFWKKKLILKLVEVFFL